MADLTVSSSVDTFMAAANQTAMLAALNITLGGAFATSGSFTTTLTVTGNTNVTLPTSGTLAVLGANVFTAAQSISVGTNSPTAATGLTLINSTAATVGVQSASPEWFLTGQGWKTTATAGSQTVSWGQSVLPVQGTTNPSAIWRLQGYVNGSAVANPQIQAQTNGPLIVTGVTGNTDILLLRQPDAYMGSAASFTLNGSAGITICGTLTAYPSTTGVRINENGNSSNYLSFISVSTFQTISSSSNIINFAKATTAQTIRIFGTYTDESNYVRLALNTTSTTMEVACETAGTGADNIDLGLTPAGTGLVAFSNAASADIAVASTHSARVKFNGTEYKVLLATP